MKTVSISGSLRENVGKKDAKEKRKQGLVPCVIYGGKEQIHFYANELSFRNLLYTPESSLVKIDINGKSFDAILQDAQFHPVTDKILHADFLETLPDKPVKIDIPIKLEGDAPGLIEGGKLHLLMRKLRVKALPGDLPDNIVIDISAFEIGDSTKISSLDAKYEKLEFLNNPNSVIVMIKTTRASSIGMELGEQELEAEEVAEGEEKAEEAKAGEKDKETKDDSSSEE